uniref:RRM domain-containing protein n=1 Tax=Bos mutus grunniens TaxID=30521 RepID=A0A8C0AJ28_BOSMU
MVKLFIGNLPGRPQSRRSAHSSSSMGRCWNVTSLRTTALMPSATCTTTSCTGEHQREASKNKSKASTKLHVGNISPTCTNQELRAKFEEYGPVIECDIVKDYAFVHMERAEDAVEAIRGLDNTEFQGKRMHVQLSTSRPHCPGMGDQSGCYRCGKEGTGPKSVQ